MPKGLAAGVPMDRLDRPDEIAHAVLFLASDASSYLTSAKIQIGGGAS